MCISSLIPTPKKKRRRHRWLRKQHIKAIKNWVKNGGTLVLLANDTSNCEIPHFNQLAAVFGIRFSDKSRNMVKNNQFEQGAITVPTGNSIFHAGRKLYIKELSVLELTAPAQALLCEGQDVIMATAHYGKGTGICTGRSLAVQ